MSTTYKIILQNDHGKRGKYSVFNSPPKFSETGTTDEVYTNAWITDSVAANGTLTITTSTEVFACMCPYSKRLTRNY